LIETIENAFIITTPTHWHYPLETNERGLRMVGLEDFLKLLIWYLLGKPWEVLRNIIMLQAECESGTF
jgi:hypothetical protein